MKFVVLLLSVIPLSAYRAWALLIMAGWFVFPYSGFVDISVMEVTGVLMMVTLVRPYKNDDRDIWIVIAGSLVATSLVLGFGFLVHLLA